MSTASSPRAPHSTVASRAGAWALTAAVLACSTRRDPPPPEPREARRRDDAGPTHPGYAAGGDPSAGSRATGDPGRPAAGDVAYADEACGFATHAVPAAGWSLLGFRPGPAARDVVAVDRRRLLAITSRRVCTSDDGGESWTERLAAHTARGVVSLAHVEHRAAGETWMVAVHEPSADDAHAPAPQGVVDEVYVSRDGDGERWDAVALPAGAPAPRAAFTDGHGRLFAASDTRIFERDGFDPAGDGASAWNAGRALPGREAAGLDACGTVLIARAHADDDWFYHRSFDRGRTWRPFRLGAIGLEGNSSVLRCVTPRGGIEAGRPPLASHWTWDGGRTWQPAAYDPAAHQVAHAMAESTDARGVFPHCAAGPGRLIECMDTGRLRLIASSGRAQEIHGPSTCEFVRQVDDHRTLAFGPGCGVYVSTDRGGLWRMVTQSLAARAAGPFAEGRGGFISASVAWRLDGGVWWTFDGGAHWVPYFSIGERALERGAFVDAHHGVFANSAGWVLATRDGGRTWTYVLRGEVERIASSGHAVIVTTTQSVRVSPDGGVTWLAAGALAPASSLDPTVEVVGTRRSIALGAALRVVQQDGAVRVESGDGAPARELVRGLPARYQLLAAHASRSGVDRVLLEGGTVLARGFAAPSAPSLPTRRARRAAHAPPPAHGRPPARRRRH